MTQKNLTKKEEETIRNIFSPILEKSKKKQN